jgi:hypothetical protein
MKTVATNDFTIKIVDEEWEVPAKVSQYFKGIFSAILNYTVTVYFIPEIDRSKIDWPPKFDEDKFENETSYLEARLTTLTLGKYVVTPSRSLAGQEELIPSFSSAEYSDYLSSKDIVVFYVSPEEYDEFSQGKCELQSKEFYGPSEYDNFWKLSNIKKYQIGQFISERFLKSEYLDRSHAHILGQVAVPHWKDRVVSLPIQT